MFQLSQKYKSSADLVSELLKKPVFTRYRSIKKKSGSYGQRSSEINSNLAVIRSEPECPPPPLESVSLVKNLNPGRKQDPTDVSMIEVQTVHIKSPVTLKPRIETVNSGRAPVEQTDSPSDTTDSHTDDGGFEVKQSKVQTNTSLSTNTTNRTNNTDTVTSASHVSVLCPLRGIDVLANVILWALFS